MYQTDFYGGKRVLVTGGNGLIGSHTIDALVELRANVRVTFNINPPSNRINCVDYVHADLTNAKKRFLEGIMFLIAQRQAMGPKL